MATLSVTVPDALVPRVVAALRGQYPDITAGLTDANAARAVLRHQLRTVVIAHEKRQAQAAQQTAATDAEQKAWVDTETIS